MGGAPSRVLLIARPIFRRRGDPAPQLRRPPIPERPDELDDLSHLLIGNLSLVTRHQRWGRVPGADLRLRVEDGLTDVLLISDDDAVVAQPDLLPEDAVEPRGPDARVGHVARVAPQTE